MAYDGTHGVTVLFGGLLADYYGGDTWNFGVGCSAPLFTLSPAAQTVFTGLPASFQAAAPGATSYRWRRNGIALSDGGPISGATGPVLSLATVSASDAGWYTCVATNECGSVASVAALLTVACYANCDGSTVAPILNVNDFVCFQTRFAAANPYANCDGSTVPPVLNVNDFICFQTRFAAGCH